MDDNWEWYENRKIHAERKKKQQIQNAEYSWQKLADMIKRRMTTTMIGALDKFEKEFGDLWNADNASAEDRAKWSKIRKQVLDNGNNQLRILLDELENFDVNWLRYRMEFRPYRKDNYNE